MSQPLITSGLFQGLPRSHRPASEGEPEQVNPENVLVEGDRLPVDEDIVAALMATINKGNGKVLPPIHLWEKPSGSNLILVAGRNRLEARSEHWISARIIRGDTPEIVRAVKLRDRGER
jgi:hypothetical protein